MYVQCTCIDLQPYMMLSSVQRLLCARFNLDGIIVRLCWREGTCTTLVIPGLQDYSICIRKLTWYHSEQNIYYVWSFQRNTQKLFYAFPLFSHNLDSTLSWNLHRLAVFLWISWFKESKSVSVLGICGYGCWLQLGTLKYMYRHLAVNSGSCIQSRYCGHSPKHIRGSS